MGKAQADAQALFAAGNGRLGTEESAFVRLLAAESHEQLAVVFDAYQRQFSRSIEQVLESEMSGDLLDGMLAIGTPTAHSYFITLIASPVLHEYGYTIIFNLHICY